MDLNALHCPKCNTVITPDVKFCPQCGTQIVSHIGVGKQAWIYFVSLFLPPLGLIWTFKYIRSSHTQVRGVAIAAAVLTVVSTAVTIWATLGVVNFANQQINQQLNYYQHLGY